MDRVDCRDTGDARGTIDCLDLLTGKKIWSGVLPKNRNTYRSSPTVADGKLYIARQDGTIFVLDAMGGDSKILAENTIAEEHTVASQFVSTAKSFFAQIRTFI